MPELRLQKQQRLALERSSSTRPKAERTHRKRPKKPIEPLVLFEQPVDLALKTVATTVTSQGRSRSRAGRPCAPSTPKKKTKKKQVDDMEL